MSKGNSPVLSGPLQVKAGKKMDVSVKKQKIISAAVTLAAIIWLPQMLLSSGKGLDFSNSFLSVLLWALSFPAVDKALWKDGSLQEKKGWRFFFAFVFVLACLFGRRLESAGYVDFTDWGMWISIPFLTFFFGLLTGRLWQWLEGKRTLSAYQEARMSERRKNLVVFLFFLVIWGIVLLAVYPGFFVYDAQDEFNQVALRSFTTHHPLLHVLLLGGIISLGNKLFSSYNMGIALYMLFQMAVMAGCFTYVLSFFRKRGTSGWFRAAGFLYFAFFPVIQMYVLCSAKDTLYSAGMILVIVLLLQLFEERESAVSWKTYGLLLVSLFVMAAMRHNGFYILLLLIPVTGIGADKNKRKKVLAAGIGALALYLLVTGGLGRLLHAQENGENQEMLTVPIQQLVRVYSCSPSVFTKEEREILLTFLPEEALQRYTPKLSDRVKIDFNNESYKENPSQFWKLWWSVGRKAPAAYLNAWLLTSYGFWYPDAVIDVYRGNTVFTYTYEDSSYFGFETELPGVRESKIPFLNEWFRRLSLELFQQKVPVLSMLFSPGFLFLIYLSGLLFLMKQKEFGRVLAFLPVVLNWGTVILGPTYLVRYVLIFWFALPVLGYVVSTGKLCYTNGKTDVFP